MVTLEPRVRLAIQVSAGFQVLPDSVDTVARLAYQASVVTLVNSEPLVIQASVDSAAIVAIVASPEPLVTVVRLVLLGSRATAG